MPCKTIFPKSKIPSGYTLATLEDEFPFEAMVWDDDEKDGVKRVVWAINKNLKYPIVCYDCKTISEIKICNMHNVHYKNYEKITTDPTEKIKSKLIELTNLINQIL